MPKKKSPAATSPKKGPLDVKELTSDLSARIVKAFAHSGRLDQAVEAAVSPNKRLTKKQADVWTKTLHHWLERGRTEKTGIYKALSDGLSFPKRTPMPRALVEVHRIVTERSREWLTHLERGGPKKTGQDTPPEKPAPINRGREYLGALFDALYHNVEKHHPALAKAFELEVHRILTERSKQGMVWEFDPDPAAEAIRKIDLPQKALRQRRQLKDPHEHLQLLRAHRAFHYVLALLRQAWKAKHLPLEHRLDILQEILPRVAGHLGFSKKEPPRNSNDPREIALEQIDKGRPEDAAFLLVAHYTGHTEETVRSYIKRERLAFASQGLDWKIIQPFPAR